ncbi:hypothetical protein [Bartonella sp. LJL80]
MKKLSPTIFPVSLALVSLTLSLTLISSAKAQDGLPDINLNFPQDKQDETQSKPPLTPYASPQSPENQAVQQATELTLNARLTDKGEDIHQGLVWRVYEPLVGVDNKLPLIATSDGGTAHFNLEPGSYLVHVSFGRAGAMRRITVQRGQNIAETMVLDAGGLELNATLPEGKINPVNLRFTIYSDDSENDDTALILSDIKPGKITRLKAGTYHIVSNYGSANAISRSDIRVDAGKITEATMQHHAAQITLKLVRQEGGEALADTSWSITNDSGDIVRETVGAYASLVLAEGDYVAIAKNKDQLYQRAFSVTSGHDEDVDVLANAQSMQPIDDSMD